MFMNLVFTRMLEQFFAVLVKDIMDYAPNARIPDRSARSLQKWDEEQHPRQQNPCPVLRRSENIAHGLPKSIAPGDGVRFEGSANGG